MNIIPEIARRASQLTIWRQDLHAHPELAFEEHRTAAFVVEKLREFGIETHAGLAGTGVVGVLRSGDSPRSIGLRADMDALPIEERSQHVYRSTQPGKMHACGHDGHTVMLLGAAQHLAASRDFDGVVYFIFQPAEENEGGGRVLVNDEQLFTRFPADKVFALHTAPGVPAGAFATRTGAFLASMDRFEALIKGTGAHAAAPHLSQDSVLIAAQIVTAWQGLISRETPAQEAAVISVTQIHGGETWNAIPREVVLRGTTRTYSPAVQDRIERRLCEVAKQLCSAFGAECDFRYWRQYPPLINTAEESTLACDVAAGLVSEANVYRDAPPVMGSDDFAFMLQQRPGNYLWIGNGAGEDARMLHDAEFDFNDAILPLGATYWVRMVEAALPRPF